MFEVAKNKIANIEYCVDSILDNTFNEVEKKLKSRNIEFNKFIEMVDSIEIVGYAKAESEYFVRGDNKVVYNSVNFDLNDGRILNWHSDNRHIDLETFINTFSE